MTWRFCGRIWKTMMLVQVNRFAAREEPFIEDSKTKKKIMQKDFQVHNTRSKGRSLNWLEFYLWVSFRSLLSLGFLLLFVSFLICFCCFAASFLRRFWSMSPSPFVLVFFYLYIFRVLHLVYHPQIFLLKKNNLLIKHKLN